VPSLQSWPGMPRALNGYAPASAGQGADPALSAVLPRKPSKRSGIRVSASRPGTINLRRRVRCLRQGRLPRSLATSRFSSSRIFNYGLPVSGFGESGHMSDDGRFGSFAPDPDCLRHLGAVQKRTSFAQEECPGGGPSARLSLGRADRLCSTLEALVDWTPPAPTAAKTEGARIQEERQEQVDTDEFNVTASSDLALSACGAPLFGAQMPLPEGGIVTAFGERPRGVAACLGAQALEVASCTVSLAPPAAF
jgi:hypothetical protein